MLCFPLLLVTVASQRFGDDDVDFLFHDNEQCDRECRWNFGFYDRNVTGLRVGLAGRRDRLGHHCRCYRDGREISRSVERVTTKTWDDAEFWCGRGGNGTAAGFNTTFVCVLDSSVPQQVRTTTRAAATAKNEAVVHCGKCAACSHPADVRVLYSTRHFITTAITRCATKFAKPAIFGGNHNLTDLRKCLVDASITFDNTRRLLPGSPGDGDGNGGGGGGSGGDIGPTCMECWTDNIQCDSAQCSTDPSCIAKFINPNNTGAFSGCLQCDETHCGAEFIRCAGANRRSTGILSDIARSAQQVCDRGWYWECSQCHAKCGEADEACNKRCEALPSCAGPTW